MITTIRKLSVCLTLSLLLPFAPQAARGQQATTQIVTDVLREYSGQWLSATGGLMQITANTVIDYDQPDPKQVAALREGVDRLESGVVSMIRLGPPTRDLNLFHITLVPRLMEIVGATRDSLDAIDRRNGADTEAALNWVEDAIAQFQGTLESQANPK